MKFDEWWLQMKPAECDELKDVFKECWEESILECIAHLQARPSRNSVTSLKGLLQKERIVKNKPSKDHPWRKDLK